MQVPCVNDTVHLRLSSTADLQGIVFPMVFDLQVHCEKTHGTSELKCMVFHCPCDSALPLTCRCTVSRTHGTCESKSNFFLHPCLSLAPAIFFLAWPLRLFPVTTVPWLFLMIIVDELIFSPCCHRDWKLKLTKFVN